jgi:hypothetical protein
MRPGSHVTTGSFLQGFAMPKDTFFNLPEENAPFFMRKEANQKEYRHECH